MHTSMRLVSHLTTHERQASTPHHVNPHPQSAEYYYLVLRASMENRAIGHTPPIIVELKYKSMMLVRFSS